MAALFGLALRSLAGTLTESLSRSTMGHVDDALPVSKATIPVRHLLVQRSRMCIIFYSVTLFVAFLNNVWH